jgi:hypothetical protein
MLVLLFFFGIIALYTTPALAAVEIDLYLHGESFTWKEFDDGEVVKETGPLEGVGASAKWDIKTLTLKIKGEVFGGRVNYDGSTTGSSTRRDVDSDTDYLGTTLEGTAGWLIPVGENSFLEPFGGAAMKYWNRSIQSASIENVQVVETEENWFILYAPVGIRGTYFVSDTMTVFAEGGVRIPVYNQNEADLRELYGVRITVHPGRKISGFAEAGVKWKLGKVSVFYEGLRFSKSDPETEDIHGGTLTVLQPKSEADIFGIKAGVSF